MLVPDASGRTILVSETNTADENSDKIDAFTVACFIAAANN